MNTRVSGRAFAIAAACLAAPALAQGSLAMLDTLQKGGWEVRYRDDGGTNRKLCVRSGREFIQLRHADSGCNRFVVEDSAKEVTVQYTCRGNGYGRTSIRKETPALIQIDSQGIAEGKPFQFTAEARRTAVCD